MRTSKWKHASKFKRLTFRALQDRTVRGKDNVFAFVCDAKPNLKTKTYDSWQAAKRDGWIKLK